MRNILKLYPNATIFQEVYTGTKVDGRRKWEQLLRTVQPNDAIIFDSVSRMSRNAEEGFSAYQELYERDVDLVFLKEPHINTQTYKQALSNHVKLTGDKVDYILEDVNKYSLESRIMMMQQYEAEANNFKAKTEEIKNSIKEQMAAAQAEELVTPNFVVRFVDVLTSRFDTKLFKETCGEVLYNQFLKQVASKRFTVT